MTFDPRCLPLVELTRDEVRRLVEPVARGADIRSVTRVDGGLVNTTYRIELAGDRARLALRIYAAGADSFEKERGVLGRVSPTLAVPEVLLAEAAGLDFAHPYIVYRWVDGTTLNELRRQNPAALLDVAEPLGRLAAGVAASSFPDHLPSSPTATSALARAEDQLRDGPARGRLGRTLADSLRARLDACAARLAHADHAAGLVHGDFGGRNVIVAPADNGDWGVVGLIDWESAFTGSALWDVGSLFRYARRYSAAFRQRFEAGYRDVGGTLPSDWLPTSRLLDSTRLVAILSERRHLPGVFAELRELIDELLRDTEAGHYS